MKNTILKAIKVLLISCCLMAEFSFAQTIAGTHKVALQWISWDYFGTVKTVSQNGDGSWQIEGGQVSKTNGDYLKISGVIDHYEMPAKTLVFSGTIVTKVSHINGGQACVRRGNFEFKAVPGRRYWRLTQMQNPCDGVTDYVDIFF
jgi:hypothetical protein